MKQSYGASNSLRLVFWETTTGCNLECIHCRRLEASKELAKSDLTTEEALAFIDAVTAAYKPIFVLSGGEPLMRPDIFEIASFAIEKGLTVALATNGTLVSEEIAQKIKAVGIDRVSISLDGASAKTHDNFRKIDGAFERAMQGIAHLRTHDVPFQINVTVAKHNVDELPDLYDLSLRIDAVALHLFMLVPVGCGVEIADEMMLSPERQEEVLNWLYDISREEKLQVKSTCAPQYYRIIRQRAKAEGITLSFQTHGMAAVTKGCLAGTGVCFVSHKGEVFPCGYLPVTAGNIRSEPFSEIWERAEVFKELRNPELLKGKCGLCEYKKVCGGCRARAFAQFGDFLDEEPYCIYQPKTRR
ncbi:radical SAM protein [bacterium]|nr:radical SAM protein [bacterium]